jgi:hypothetical protein
MAKPDFSSEVNAGTFYLGGARVQCPRCNTPFRIDDQASGKNAEEKALFILAADVLADMCPACGLFIIINMLSAGQDPNAPARVVFEGFLNSGDQDNRIKELATIWKRDKEVREKGSR